MYLVLAIIMGVILFTRFQCDKTSSKEMSRKNQEEIDKSRSEFYEFQRKYVSRACEAGCEDEIKESSDFAERIRVEINKVSGLEPTREMILMGMMAESCKIPYKFASFGISSPLRCNSTYEEFDNYSKKYLKFLVWYNKKLMSHGMEHELIFVKNDDEHRLYYKSNPKLHDRLAEVDNPRHQGVYLWEPMRFMTNIFGSAIS